MHITIACVLQLSRYPVLDDATNQKPSWVQSFNETVVQRHHLFG